MYDSFQHIIYSNVLILYCLTLYSYLNGLLQKHQQHRSQHVRNILVTSVRKYAFFCDAQ